MLPVANDIYLKPVIFIGGGNNQRKSMALARKLQYHVIQICTDN